MNSDTPENGSQLHAVPRSVRVDGEVDRWLEETFPHTNFSGLVNDLLRAFKAEWGDRPGPSAFAGPASVRVLKGKY